ncbi:MAG: radical SAM family heme chaperone HemW [Bacteroidota bacterium]
MAGIYIHIPYCKQVCYYCDFHFSASLKDKGRMIKAILKEAEMQKDYLRGQSVNTIYFGGGTPSVLDTAEVQILLEALMKHYPVTANPEVTFEANPDDLTAGYLQHLINIGINRLSTGIQSFHDKTLQWLNRRHDAKQSYQCIDLAQKAGFDNINIDLIYGIPGMTSKEWEYQLDEVFAMNIQHLSAYLLGIEPKTVLDFYLRKQRFKPVDDDACIEQHQILLDKIRQYGFIPYEISNFAPDGCISQHNTGYWRGAVYLGLGPSAHSYNRDTRQWNIAFNKKYMEAIEQDRVPCTVETTDNKTAYNDYVLTNIRTIWGIDPIYVSKTFGAPYHAHMLRALANYIETGTVVCKNGTYILSDQGRCIVNTVAEDLFIANY